MTTETQMETAAIAPENGMMYLGVLLMIAGVIAVIVAFAYDVSVETDYNPLSALPSRVANIDKISFREMILWCGGFSFVAGAVLYAGGRIRGALTALIPKHSRIDAAPAHT